MLFQMMLPEYQRRRLTIAPRQQRYIGVDTTTGFHWYEAARAWAIEQNISDGTMADGNVTCEQFVTMLWRLSGEPAVDNAARFTDSGKVSDYAKTAVAWAVSEDIVNGCSDDIQAPGQRHARQGCQDTDRFCVKQRNSRLAHLLKLFSLNPNPKQNDPPPGLPRGGLRIVLHGEEIDFHPSHPRRALKPRLCRSFGSFFRPMHQLPGLADRPRIVQRERISGRMVEALKVFCVWDLRGNFGVFGLKLLQFRTPFRPSVVGNQILIHFVIDDAVDQYLSAPPVNQFSDSFGVHTSRFTSVRF